MDLEVDELSIQDSVETWGPEKQSVVCMEECAELIQQISKCIRGKEDKKHLTEEVADVIISIHILKRIYDLHEDELQQFIWEKQNRTDLRIQKEKKDGQRN